MQEPMEIETASIESYSALQFTPQRPRFQSASGQHGQISCRASSGSPRRTTKDCKPYKCMPPDSAAAQKMLQV
jgi:hypothetical protein